MAASSKILLISMAILLVVEALNLNVTRIQFYMHDIVSGPNTTGIQVARRRTNYTGSDPIAAMFGSIFMMDYPLTVAPGLGLDVDWACSGDLCNVVATKGVQPFDDANLRNDRWTVPRQLVQRRRPESHHERTPGNASDRWDGDFPACS
ncbi:Dirigent protein 15, partial [Cucurbita argyrosperma subsp. sororia]